MANKSLPVNSIGLRILLIVGIVVCIAAAYYAARWSFGSTLAEQAQFQDVTELAIELSPADSQGHFRLASFYEKTFLNEDLPKSLAEYEKAVALAPYDYRLWLALGRARERSGDAKAAEKAMRRAVELAPNYAETHWLLGNGLLRQGNTEEAFVELRRAVEQDNKYANQIVFTAWQIFDGDVTQIAQKIGDSVPIKAGLAPFLARQGRFDEALSFWNSIPQNEMSSVYKAYGDEIYAKLIEKKEYRKALAVYSQTNVSETDKFSVGNIFNGDFERDVKSANAAPFDWQIAGGQQPQIGLDNSQKHAGGKALVLLFNSPTGEDFRAVSQMVVVESGKTYKFEAFYRADLKTSATLQWEIVDLANDKVLATTPAANAASDWARLSAEFTVPAGTQAVSVRLARAACKQGLCPVSGKIWFDDITLK